MSKIPFEVHACQTPREGEKVYSYRCASAEAARLFASRLETWKWPVIWITGPNAFYEEVRNA